MAPDNVLSEDCHERLIRAAIAEGVTPDQWIESRLPRQPVDQVGAVPPEVRALLWQQVVSVPGAVGIDNESIDAELARAYADTHDDQIDRGKVE